MSDRVQRSEEIFWIWLSLRLGAGNRMYPLLLERFGDAYDIFEAKEERLHEIVPELTFRQLAALSNKKLDDAFVVEEYCRNHGVRILRYNEDAYPFSYRALSDPPLLLYCRGELPLFQKQLCVAIVGTRRMSEYGRGMAYKLAYELASAGVIIVSGMALGIDSVAACAAMKAGGKTIAILGGGIDVPYPPEHEYFMEAIAKRGVLFSEFAPGSEPKRAHFPIRNRLISGLCQATVVIDADDRSGALITAERTIEQGRDLFAVPANVGAANASGTNRLIRDGAHVALSSADILSHYEFLYPDLKTPVRGEASDYDASVISEMGVYSRVVGGLVRVPAQNAGGSPFSTKTNAIESPDHRSPWKQAESKQSKKTSTEAGVNRGKPGSSSSKITVQPKDASVSASQNAQSGNDPSGAALASLNETQLAIFNAIPTDAPISVDQLKRLGFPIGGLLAAISVLQIKGLVKSLPGGMVSRA